MTTDIRELWKRNVSPEVKERQEEIDRVISEQPDKAMEPKPHG